MKMIAAIASMAAACVPATMVRAQAAEPPANTAEPAPTESEPEQVRTGPAMTSGVFGDWGGVRTKLFDKGLDLQLGYGSEVATNFRGGSRHDVTDIGQVIAGVGIDFDKLAGIEGGTGKVSLFYRHGPSLSLTANLGVLQQVQEAYGRGEIVRLVEAWYQQSFAGDRFRLKVGRMPVNGDFASFACDFQNLSFCASPQGNFPSGITYWFSAPSSNWGAIARYNLGRKRASGYFQIGAYQVNPKNIDPTDGFRLSFSGGTGVLIPFEAALTPTLGGDRPGYYKIGGWIETSRADDLVRDRDGQLTILSGQPADRFRGRHGVYLEIAQQLTPSPEGLDRKGLSVFANATFLDKKSSFIDNQLEAGLTQTGTFAGRPHDQVAIAVARMHVNSRLDETERIEVGRGLLPGVRNAEYLIEADYRLVPTTGVKISPNMQWSINPGAMQSARNVLVGGIKSSISF